MAKSAAQRQREYRARIKAGIVLPPKTARPHREYKDKWAYGLPYGSRARMLEEQGGKCLICKTETALVMDHNHRSGEVRGLICQQCNKGLGDFKDDLNTLWAAAEYLAKYGF